MRLNLCTQSTTYNYSILFASAHYTELCQVINLLPGGLGVVGMFCVCSKEVLPSVQPRVARILPQLTPHPHTIFLHVYSLSGMTKALVLHDQRVSFVLSLSESPCTVFSVLLSCIRKQIEPIHCQVCTNVINDGLYKTSDNSW